MGQEISEEYDWPSKRKRVWKIRTIQELMGLCREPNIISEIGKEKLRRLGHVERVPGEGTVRQILKNITSGKRCVGKPRDKWLYDAEYDMKKIGVRGCRKTARDTDVWKLILKEARVLHGT
jgi:hypothetical protein